MSACPTCGAASQAGRYCANCGRLLGAIGPAAAPPPAREPAPAPASTSAPAHAPATGTGAAGAPAPYGGYAGDGTAPTEGVALAALLLNILIWPGLGSLIAGENVGWAQGFLFLFGIPLTILLVGIPMLIGAWIWGIVTGVQLLQQAGAVKRGAPAQPPPPYL